MDEVGVAKAGGLDEEAKCCPDAKAGQVHGHWAAHARPPVAQLSARLIPTAVAKNVMAAAKLPAERMLIPQRPCAEVQPPAQRAP